MGWILKILKDIIFQEVSSWFLFPQDLFDFIFIFYDESFTSVKYCTAWCCFKSIFLFVCLFVWLFFFSFFVMHCVLLIPCCLKFEYILMCFTILCSLIFIPLGCVIAWLLSFSIVLSSENPYSCVQFVLHIRRLLDNSQRPHGGLSLCTPSWRAHVSDPIHATQTAAFMRDVVSVNVSHVKYLSPV